MARRAATSGKPAVRNAPKVAKRADKTGRSAGAEARKSIAAAEISLAEAAEITGLTKQWLNRLNRDGYVLKSARGRYLLANVVQGYVRFLKDEDRRTSKSASASRVQDARAAEIEFRIAREKGQLIETAEAIAFVDEALGLLKSEFDGMPARLTRDVEFRRKIETQIDDVFRRAADRAKQAADALASGGGVVDADAEDDA